MNERNVASEHWCIAYREKGQEQFHLVSNPQWAWAADPFLVEYQDEILLFAELFLFKSERSGVLGYCKWNGDGFDEWQVTMDKHWHLSYPNVFVLDGKLYMVPESYQREDISLYVLEEFPDKWKRVKTLVDNVASVDTTFFEYSGKQYMFSFEPSFVENGGSLLLYGLNKPLNSEDCICSRLTKISDDKAISRPAGNIFTSDDGRLIRPSQNCVDGYGRGISFMQIDSVEPNYREHLVGELRPDEIKIMDRCDESLFTGVHTYNALGNIEVIDLKYSVYDKEEQEARARVRKVFVEKYV